LAEVNEMSLLKRTKYLIDPQVQWAIGRRIIFHWAIFACFLLVINASVLVFLASGAKPIEDDINAAVLSQVPALVLLICCLPFFVFDTIKLTHRIAGPMFRLRVGIDELINKSRAEPLRLRRDDMWKYVGDEFNGLANQYQALSQRNRELEQELRSLRHESLASAGRRD